MCVVWKGVSAVIHIQATEGGRKRKGEGREEVIDREERGGGGGGGGAREGRGATEDIGTRELRRR